MATETFANFPATTVPAGADGSSGTETWVVSSSDGFPTASTGVTQFHVADTNQAASSELVLVTNMSGTDNNTWTVTRGAEGTDPVTHQPGFTITAVITAGWLNAVSGTSLPAASAGALLYGTPAAAADWLGGNTTGTKEFLTSTGSSGTANTPVWGTISVSDVPVLNQNTTGTAANVTGVVAVGNGGTGGTSATAYAVVTGGTSATTALQTVASAGTVGQVLTSQGAGVLPQWSPVGTAVSVSGTVATINGGTGLGSVTSYAVITGGTTSTAALQQVSGPGTSGQVLASSGAGSLPTWQNAPVDWINVVTGYGADPSGSADSTTAIQAAINAGLAQSTSVSAGGIQAALLAPTVFVPDGNYLISSPLTFGGSAPTIRFTGNWGSRIFSNASGIIDFQNNNHQGLEVDHLTLDATGGHIFANPNLNYCYFHHLYLIQRSPGYALMDFEQSNGGLSETVFSDIQTWVLSDPVSGTRSTAGWKLYPQQGAVLAGVTFDRILSNNYPGANGSAGTRDSTQYAFDLACTQTGSSSAWVTNVRFNHCTFNRFFGGCIRVLSGANIGISNCKPDNLSTNNGVSWTNAAIHIGKYSANPSVSKGIRIRDYQRGSGPLPTPGSEPSDFYIESTTLDTAIDGATDSSSATPTGPQANLNGAGGVVIQSADASLNVLNPAADTIRINGGTITAEVVSASAPLTLYQAPTGALAETFPRWGATGTTGQTSTGVIYAMGIPLTGGLRVSNITLVNSGTASTVSHGWYGLLDSNLIVRAVSADQGSGTWSAANTAVTLAMASPYTVPSGGLYFVAWSVTASSMPTWYRNSGAQSTIMGLAPVLCGSSSTVSGTPPSIGSTLNSLASSGAFPVYAYLT